VSILRDVLSSPTPPPDYRGALRAALPVEDATRVLEVYAKWLVVHVEKPSRRMVSMLTGGSACIAALTSLTVASDAMVGMLRTALAEMGQRRHVPRRSALCPDRAARLGKPVETPTPGGIQH
jgi:hypothetical protein